MITLFKMSIRHVANFTTCAFAFVGREILADGVGWTSLQNYHTSNLVARGKLRFEIVFTSETSF